jgi:regulator of protease activity HflC (stomatin/prohibitin superfamily)
MKIRVLSTPYNIVITKDNVKLTIDTSVAFRIINPITAYYKLGS